jgi:hypothetical protein
MPGVFRCQTRVFMQFARLHHIDYGLRVYKDNDDRGIGLEASVEAYIANLVDVFREVKRCLRDDGVCWVNLGDSYTGDGGYSPNAPSNVAGSLQAKSGGEKRNTRTSNHERPAGNRLGIPERVVLALQADGWIWRDTVIWAKKSAMPESLAGWRWEQCRVKVASAARNIGPEHPSGNRTMTSEHIGTVEQAEWSDCPDCPKCAGNDGLVLRKGSWRNTSAHEYIFMMTKGMGYYADGEAVRIVHKEPWRSGTHETNNPHSHSDDGGTSGAVFAPGRREYNPNGANRRSVWNDISPEPYGGSHFATFPSDLPRICIQASTSEKGCCSECGSQWARVVDHKNMEITRTDWGEKAGNRTASSGTMTAPAETQTLGWRPTCTCNAGDPVPALVLDPFAGTFTTGLAAQKLGRRAVGVDLSEAYLQQAVKRLEAVTLPMRLV